MTFLKVKNRASSSLTATISATDTSLTVSTGDGAKFPDSNFHITIDNEILLCTSRTNDTLTVTRAQEGTTAATHSAGALVQLRVTAAIIEELQTEKLNRDGTIAITANWDVDGANTLYVGKTNGRVGIGTTSPTAKLDINGSTGYNQLRMRTSYTPTSSSDTNGNVGDIAWDNNYIYIKTSAGWKRAALTAF